MKIACIYRIYSISKLDRIYIGSTVDYSYRKWKHFNGLKNNKHYNDKLQRHFNKYNADLKIEIIERILDNSKLIEREQYYINLYNPYFNILKKAGSKLGHIQSKEEKRARGRVKNGYEIKMKIQLELLKKFSSEHKSKISKSMLGKKHSDETKLKISKANKGQKQKPITEETRKKLSLSKKGKKRSAETCEKIRKAHIGKPFIMTEEQKLKQILALKGKKRSQAFKDNLSKLRKGVKRRPEHILKSIEARRISQLLKKSA